MDNDEVIKRNNEVRRANLSGDLINALGWQSFLQSTTHVC